MDIHAFLLRTHIGSDLLTTCIEEGWLAPRHRGERSEFSDVDVARARFILDLKGVMGVNDEGITIVLDLVDQVHGLRRTLRDIASGLRQQPDSVRHALIAGLRDRSAAPTGGTDFPST
jgi:chaperone modulatory protein CbpM